MGLTVSASESVGLSMVMSLNGSPSETANLSMVIGSSTRVRSLSECMSVSMSTLMSDYEP